MMVSSTLAGRSQTFFNGDKNINKMANIQTHEQHDCSEHHGPFLPCIQFHDTSLHNH